jgi:hypothetical protein
MSNVILTLAMVETPSSAITVTPASESTHDAEAKEHLLETGPAITLVAQKPITSSIRATIRHLRAHAGRLAPWRGFPVFFLYHIAFSFLGNIILAILASFVFQPVAVVLATSCAGALLVPLHASWTHKVITMPTKARFWQRMLPFSTVKHLLLPAGVAASAQYAAIFVAGCFVKILALDRVSEEDSQISVILRALSVVAVFIAASLFITLPAQVTLIRVEASLLSDDQDTIVPFDRTFAGKVVSKLLGGSGCVGFVDAWKSFNWEARRRLIKLYAKAAMIEFVVMIAFAHVLIFEVWLFLGAAYMQVLAKEAERQANH